jgi:hypothetical protein
MVCFGRWDVCFAWKADVLSGALDQPERDFHHEDGKESQLVTAEAASVHLNDRIGHAAQALAIERSPEPFLSVPTRAFVGTAIFNFGKQ